MNLWDLLKTMWDEQHVTISADLAGFNSNRHKRETIFSARKGEIFDPKRKIQRFFEWPVCSVSSRLVNIDMYHRGTKSIRDEISIMIYPPEKEV